MYPSTTLGKIIASLCAVIGIMMLALPLGVISNNFNAFEKYSIRFQKIMDSLEPADRPAILIEKRASEAEMMFNQDSKTKMLE